MSTTVTSRGGIWLYR